MVSERWSHLEPPAGMALNTVLATDRLSRRPVRPPDYAAENRALLELSQHLANDPGSILQRLVETTMRTLNSGSAGLSLISSESGDFYWPAVAGGLREFAGGGTPRRFSPCCTVLDRDAAQLFAFPELYFPYLAPVAPLCEVLLTPFYVGGEAVGTVWAVAHDASRAFDSEDMRILTSLGTFAACAYQAIELLQASERESRKLNEELEERVELRTSELLATNERLQGFTYSVAHDLRQQIRGINSNACRLLEDAFDDLNEDARSTLRRLASSAARLGRLVDELLTYARIGKQPLKREEVDLSALFEELTADIDSAAAPTFKVAANLISFADPLLLRIVFESLVDNARKYARTEVPTVIEFGSEAGAFFVRDNGIGFDMQYLHKIFQPFERLHADSEYSGTGIGLANVARIVESHGGKVWAEAEVGKGATFFFTLTGCEGRA